MPVIVIHSLKDAVAALDLTVQAATTLSDPLYLVSSPGAAATMGAMVFQAITHEAKRQFPEQPFTGVLDCGSDPGYALAAIRAGVKHISFTSNDCSNLSVENIARENDCHVHCFNDKQ